MNSKQVLQKTTQINWGMTMSILTPKERLIRVLNKEKVERPPVICPGGMMSSAIVEVMNKMAHALPQADHEAKLMAELAGKVHEETGFENLGLPFSKAVEAEVLGSEINYGTLEDRPKVQKAIYSSVSMIEHKPISAMGHSSRVAAIIQAGYAISRKYPDIPLIGNLTGPISTAASIVDPRTFLKGLREDKVNAHKIVDYVTDHLIEFARLMIDNGAVVIAIADSMVTEEELGAKMFDEYAVKYLNKVVDAIHAMSVPVIVHICGNMSLIKKSILSIRFNAISTDAFIDLKVLKQEYPNLTTMGNLSTFSLEFSQPAEVALQAERLVTDGVDIIAPACGLTTSTPLANIKAMTSTVKNL